MRIAIECSYGRTSIDVKALGMDGGPYILAIQNRYGHAYSAFLSRYPDALRKVRDARPVVLIEEE